MLTRCAFRSLSELIIGIARQVGWTDTALLARLSHLQSYSSCPERSIGFGKRIKAYAHSRRCRWCRGIGALNGWRARQYWDRSKRGLKN